MMLRTDVFGMDYSEQMFLIVLRACLYIAFFTRNAKFMYHHIPWGTGTIVQCTDDFNILQHNNDFVRSKSSEILPANCFQLGRSIPHIFFLILE